MRELKVEKGKWASKGEKLSITKMFGFNKGTKYYKRIFIYCAGNS
jgi:hypothetical protein